MAEPRIFQLADDTGGDSESASPFVALGYRDNPFPHSGVSGPLYTAHMPEALKQINRWLGSVQQATDSSQNGRQPVPPLALRGALGVGKTHLLQNIEGGLAQYSRFPVLRRNLAEGGMTKLLLANLLLAALPNLRQTAGHLVPIAAPSTVPLLDEIVERSRSRGYAKRRDILGVLDGASQLKAPLQRILEADAAFEADLRRWLALWLTRGTTTPTQRGKLGLSAPLEGEGQAIRAIGDLMRLARKLDLLQVWFVLIDQFEELWRPQVITEGRAARFLTDVRALIDDALDGAPVAVLLAWNTKTGVEDTAEDELAERYRALWQRLSVRVNLPGLRSSDLWPFAAHYLKSVAASLGIPDSESAQRRFTVLLHERGLPLVKRQLAADPINAQLGPDHFAQRLVLQAWREVATSIAERERDPA